MPKYAQEGFDKRAPTPDSPSRVYTDVVSRPVDTYVAPPVDRKLAQLSSALGIAVPAMEMYSQYQEKKGMEDRALGKEKPENDFWGSYTKGYMTLDATVKAQEDAADIKARYLTEFNKTGSTPEDLDKWLNTQWSGKAKGLTDERFLEVYRNGLGNAFNEIRKDFTETNKAQLVQDVETNAVKSITGAIQEYVKKGEAIPPTAISSIRQTLMGEGIALKGSRFNELLFSAVDRLGKEGNYKAYEFLKSDQPDAKDPTKTIPGMYFIPAWKEKIDQAEVHSQQVYLQRQSQSIEMANKVREEQQENALYEVAMLHADGKHEEAQSKYEELRKGGLFTRASDVIKWTEKLNTFSAKVETPNNLKLQSELLTGVYTGTVGPREIVAQQGNLTPAQFQSVMKEWRATSDQNRSIAIQARNADMTPPILKSAEYHSNREMLEKFLRVSPSPLDQFGTGSEFVQQQRAEAILEFTQSAMKAQNPMELRTLAEDIRKRYHSRIRDSETRNSGALPGWVRYGSMQEVIEAAKTGKIDKSTYEKYRNLFRYGAQ